MRYFVELNYKGTNYHGWQIQPNAISVQECLEKAFSTILREKINIVTTMPDSADDSPAVALT